MPKPNTTIVCGDVNEEVTNIHYWLGQLMVEYVEEGQDHRRSVLEVTTLLKELGSKYTVHKVCGSSFSSLIIEDGFVFRKTHIVADSLLTMTGKTYFLS